MKIIPRAHFFSRSSDTYQRKYQQFCPYPWLRLSHLPYGLPVTYGSRGLADSILGNSESILQSMGRIDAGLNQFDE